MGNAEIQTAAFEVGVCLSDPAPPATQKCDKSNASAASSAPVISANQKSQNHDAAPYTYPLSFSRLMQIFYTMHDWTEAGVVSEVVT